MKKLSALLCSLFVACALYAQDYTVINVTGKIKLKKSGSVLVRGSKLSANDQLVFLDKTAVAACFSSDKGRVTLRLDPQTPKTGDEFLAYVKGSLVPAKGALMTRAGGMIKNRIEFENHFASGPYLVLGVHDVAISEKSWPMSDTTFFFLRYEYEGEQINKRLPGEDEHLTLSEDQILLVDEKKIDATATSGHELYYYNTNSQQSILMSSFQPVFADEKELAEEVLALIELLRGYKVEEDKLAGEVEAYMIEYYGKPHPEALSNWLKEKFNL